MRKSRLLWAAMAVCAVFSCQKIEETDSGSVIQKPVDEEHSVFRIGAPEIGPDTKMTLGPVEGSDSEMVLWEVGDNVWIMREGGDAGQFWANNIYDGGKSADFYGLQFNTGGKYRAVYPASSVTCWENGPAKRYDSFKAAIPSVQKYVPNSFPKDANLSMAEWDEDKGEQRLMKNLCGAIRFSLTGNFRVGYIELYSSSDLIDGYYDMAKQCFMPKPVVYDEKFDSEFSGSRIILDCNYDIERENGLKEQMSVTLDEEVPVQFNIIVAPGAFSHGFELSIYDAEGNWVNTLSTDKDNTVERSSIVVMPTINVLTEKKEGDPTLLDGLRVNEIVTSMLSKMNHNPWNAIKHVVFETGSDRTSDYVISSDSYLTKAYVDFDQSTGTVYYSTSAEQMYLESASYFFSGFNALEDITGLDKLNATSTTVFSRMFYNCGSLTEIDLTPLKAAKAAILDGMFLQCSKLTSVNLNGFATEYVETASEMFRDCNAIETIDISGIDLSYAGLGYMLMDCYELGSIKFNPDFTGENATGSEMFKNAGTGRTDRTIHIDCSYAFSAVFKQCESERYEGRCSSIGSYGPKGEETVESDYHVVNYVFKDFPTAIYTTASFNETAKNLANGSTATKAGSQMTKESVDTKIKHVRYDMFSSIKSPYHDSRNYNFMDWNEETGTITIHFTSNDRGNWIDSVYLSGEDAVGMFQNMSALEEIEGMDSFKFYYDLTSLANMFKGCSSLRHLDLSSFDDSENPNYERYNFTGFFDGTGSAIGKTMVTCSRDLMKVLQEANPTYKSSIAWDTPEREYDLGLQLIIDNRFGEKLKALANEIKLEEDIVLSSIRNSAKPISTDSDSIVDGLIRHLVFKKGGVNPVYGYPAYAHWDEDSGTMSVYCCSDSEYDNFVFKNYEAINVFKDFTALEDIQGLDMIDTYDLGNMEGMFSGCESLAELDLSSFDLSYVYNMAYAFYGCSNLTVLNLGATCTVEDVDVTDALRGAAATSGRLKIYATDSFRNAVEGNPDAGYSQSVNYSWERALPETIPFTYGLTTNDIMKEIAGRSEIFPDPDDEEYSDFISETIESITFETSCSDLVGKEKEGEIHYTWDEKNRTFTFRTSAAKLIMPDDLENIFMGLPMLKQISGLKTVISLLHMFCGTPSGWTHL